MLNVYFGSECINGARKNAMVMGYTVLPSYNTEPFDPDHQVADLYY